MQPYATDAPTTSYTKPMQNPQIPPRKANEKEEKRKRKEKKRKIPIDPV
jgi:hypothetical protein